MVGWMNVFLVKLAFKFSASFYSAATVQPYTKWNAD